MKELTEKQRKVLLTLERILPQMSDRELDGLIRYGDGYGDAMESVRKREEQKTAQRGKMKDT